MSDLKLVAEDGTIWVIQDYTEGDDHGLASLTTQSAGFKFTLSLGDVEQIKTPPKRG